MSKPLIKYFYRSAFILLACFIHISPSLKAQPVVTGSPEAILPDGNHANPQWSPSNNGLLAFSTRQNNGLWILDTETGGQTQLSDALGIGFNYKWSADANFILGRSTTFSNKRNQHAVALIDVQSTDVSMLTDYISSMPAPPTWAGRDIIYQNKRTVERIENAVPVSKTISENSTLSYYGNKLHIYASGQERSITHPFDDQQLLNQTLSADGSKIAFEVYGGNLYVMDVNTGELTDLGKGNRPSFSPDGRYVVYMETEDNGHKYTRSDLIAASIDGSQKVNLTDNVTILSINPSWSADGQKIAFDSPETGTIYILPINYDVR